MNRKGQGNPSASTFLVVVGIVIALTIGLVFGEKVADYLKPEDKSLKNFEKLANEIEGIIKDPGTGSSQSVLVHLERDELILFFDKGTESFVRLTTKSHDLAKDFYFFRSKETLDKIIDSTSKHFLHILFDKPTTCGDEACMILCRDFDVYRANKPSQILSEKATYIEEAFTDVAVVFCKHVPPGGKRTFPDIEHFYRKPVVHIEPAETKYVPAGGEVIPVDFAEKASATFYFYGLTLYSSTDNFFVGDLREKGDQVKGKLSHPDKPMIGELIDKENAEFVHLVSDNYVNVQSYGRDVVFCYKAPCVSSGDDVYLNWMGSVDACLSINECGALISNIKTYADVLKYTFSVEDDRLNLKHELKVVGGDYTMPFDWDVDLYIYDIDEDKESSVDSVFLEKVRVSTGSRFIKLSAGNKDYLFSDITATLASDEVEKPRLVFKVKEWEFEE